MIDSDWPVSCSRQTVQIVIDHAEQFPLEVRMEILGGN